MADNNSSKVFISYFVIITSVLYTSKLAAVVFIAYFSGEFIGTDNITLYFVIPALRIMHICYLWYVVKKQEQLHSCTYQTVCLMGLALTAQIGFSMCWILRGIPLWWGYILCSLVLIEACCYACFSTKLSRENSTSINFADNGTLEMLGSDVLQTQSVENGELQGAQPFYVSFSGK